MDTDIISCAVPRGCEDCSLRYI